MRIRTIKGLEDVPVTIALFEQKGKNSVVPGNFFAYARANKGSSTLGDWKDIKEEYCAVSFFSMRKRIIETI